MKLKTTDILKHLIKKHFRDDQNTLKICLETVDNIRQFEHIKQQAILMAQKIDQEFSRYLHFLNLGHYSINLSERQKFYLGL